MQNCKGLDEGRGKPVESRNRIPGSEVVAGNSNTAANEAK